jgi:cysteine desulfurase
VLLAMGLSPAQAQASLRFGLGRGTTTDDIDRAAAHVAAVVAQVRRAVRVA